MIHRLKSVRAGPDNSKKREALAVPLVARADLVAITVG
jgi:hypothetical protein